MYPEWRYAINFLKTAFVHFNGRQSKFMSSSCFGIESLLIECYQMAFSFFCNKG